MTEVLQTLVRVSANHQTFQRVGKINPESFQNRSKTNQFYRFMAGQLEKQLHVHV